jgi:hypothetical protein
VQRGQSHKDSLDGLGTAVTPWSPSGQVRDDTNTGAIESAAAMAARANGAIPVVDVSRHPFRGPAIMAAKANGITPVVHVSRLLFPGLAAMAARANGATPIVRTHLGPL